MTLLTRARTASAVVSAVLLLGGCAAAESTPASVEPGSVSSPSSTATESGEVPGARVGGPAKSTRIHFVPERVTLPGGTHAAVEPARTVDGELKVPENVQHVGWWDGSAEVGDPFGSTVIAGHVDSATEGIGYFARLLKVQVGDVVTVNGSGHQLSYKVTAVNTVSKRALATDSQALDQTSAGRLVLITCAGTYRRDQGGYDSNLVVVAKPIGHVRSSS